MLDFLIDNAWGRFRDYRRAGRAAESQRKLYLDAKRGR